MAKRTNTAVWLENQHRWQIKVQKDGQRRAFTSTTPGRNGQREANAKADRFLDEGVADAGRRVDALFADWMEVLEKTTGRGNCISIAGRWRTRIAPVVGTKRLDRVTEAQLQTILDAGCADGLSRKTLRNYLADLRAFYKWCRLQGYTVERLEALHIPASARYKEKSIMQPEDLRVLYTSSLSSWKGKPVVDPLVRAYRFQVASGLRPGELLGLRWTDISGYKGSATDWPALVGRTMSVQRAINNLGETTRGKNDNAVRAVALFPLLVELLKEQHQFTATEGSIFPIESQRQYYRALQRYCEYNKIQAVSLYELRHTFVSVVKTLPAGEVKSLVGHSRNMDTFGVYGHALQGDSARVASDLSHLYGTLLGQPTL